MTISHTLFVCTTCAALHADRAPKRAPKRDGEQLLEQLTELAKAKNLPGDFAIQAVECMFVCEKSCAVSFTAAGKYTYLFGNLQAIDSAAAILDCAHRYYLHPDGLLPYAARPEPLKTSVLARIPPQSAGQ